MSDFEIMARGIFYVLVGVVTYFLKETASELKEVRRITINHGERLSVLEERTR